MNARPISTRDLVALLMCLVAAEPASAQLRTLGGRAATDSLFVIVTGAGSQRSRDLPSARPARSLRRNLTAQEKTALIQRAFPNGLPKLPPTQVTEDPTGISKQVVLHAGQLVDPQQTASLSLKNGDHYPPFAKDIDGYMAINAGGVVKIRYRPAKVGAPLLIECDLSSPGNGKLLIQAWDQSAAVPQEFYVVSEAILAFVVIPSKIGKSPYPTNGVMLKAESHTVIFHSCAVTPLS